MTKRQPPVPKPAPAADDADSRREFERAMRGVTPLAPDPRGRVRPPPPGIPRPRQTSPASSGKEDDAGAPPDNFVAHGVDRREIRKLRRDDYRIDAELDLHGHSAAQARTAVDAFIASSRHARLRSVCIVHGRGLNSAGGVSVLKREVRARLMAMPDVLAYATAPASSGGDGAVYVLLRR